MKTRMTAKACRSLSDSLSHVHCVLENCCTCWFFHAHARCSCHSSSRSLPDAASCVPQFTYLISEARDSRTNVVLVASEYARLSRAVGRVESPSFRINCAGLPGGCRMNTCFSITVSGQCRPWEGPVCLVYWRRQHEDGKGFLDRAAEWIWDVGGLSSRSLLGESRSVFSVWEETT